MHHVFRPWFGRVLSAAIGVVCAIGLVAVLLIDPATALRAAPFLALLAGSCWAVFWRPQVEVDEGGVRLVNVFRTIDLPWPSIEAVDTKWALTLITAYGRFNGWAAPAPGARATARAARQEAKHLPASSAYADAVRPGDLPSSESGGAALVIRRHWEQLRDAGYLDNPRLEREEAPVTWHRGTILAGVLLAVLAAVALVV